MPGDEGGWTPAPQQDADSSERDNGNFGGKRGDRPERNYDRPPRRDFSDRQPRDRNGDGDHRPPRREYSDRNGDGDSRPPRRNFSDRNGDGDHRPRREYSDRPPRDRNDDGESRPRPRRNEDDGAEGDKKDEKPRELYIPPEPTNDENEMFNTAITAGINFDKFDKIDVNMTGQDAGSLKPIANFEDSGLRDFLLQNVARSGYTKPTPIQKNAIPVVMAKRDLMGCAQTGSGKTAAFILPILNTIMSENEDLSVGRPQCLIVAPTRELAIQIFEEARKFSKGSWVKVAIAYGGTASREQGDRIKNNGCHILVATPGRLKDFLAKGVVSFESLKFLVLDEADRMLDMGFKNDIDEVAKHETYDKEKVQTLMFSATFPDEIQRLAATYLRDYIFLTVGIVGGASTDVEQEIIEVTKFKKRGKLAEVLEQYCGNKEEDRILVFCETKRTADFLASYMSETKISTTSIHGDRLQREREQALREFRNGQHKVLIATSVAARGLDIKGVTHVINYDLPKDIQDYVHRIGRTGRVGNRGKATSFFDPEGDVALAGDLVRILKEANQPVPEFLGNAGGAVGGAADAFGGLDIRKGIDDGKKQEEAEEW